MANRVETPAPYVPSNDELEKATAEALGWTTVDLPGWDAFRDDDGNYLPLPDWINYDLQSMMTDEPQTIYIKPNGMLMQSYCPPFCTDRNALPELFTAVEAAVAIWKFAAELPVYDTSDDPCLIAYRAITLEPRIVVIAALKALGKWRSDLWRTE